MKPEIKGALVLLLLVVSLWAICTIPSPESEPEPEQPKTQAQRWGERTTVRLIPDQTREQDIMAQLVDELGPPQWTLLDELRIARWEFADGSTFRAAFRPHPVPGQGLVLDHISVD